MQQSSSFGFKWKKLKWKRKRKLDLIYRILCADSAHYFAITGLVWGFQWFAYSYYTVLGGEKSLVYEDPISTINKNS
jgi:hypothetical protein